MNTIAVCHYHGFEGMYVEIDFMTTSRANKKDAIGKYYLRVDKIHKTYVLNSKSIRKQAYEEGMLINQYDETNFYKSVGCYVFTELKNKKNVEAKKLAIKLMFEANNENI